MQDRPTAIELLKAVERFLDEDVVPNVTGTRQFHARVAANVMRILARELELDEEHLDAEWTSLDELLGPEERPSTRQAVREALAVRNERLCECIRNGDADGGEFQGKAVEHMRRTVRNKLLIDNPAWLQDDSPTGES